MKASEPELFAVPESPHWPIGRARVVRDAAATWLTARRPTLKRTIERARFDPSTRRARQLYLALLRRRDCRACAALHRLIEMARWVIHLEHRESPPPQIFHALAA